MFLHHLQIEQMLNYSQAAFYSNINSQITKQIQTMQQQFILKFLQGQHFPLQNNSIQSFSQTIKNNFCLLSWLNSNYHIRIIEEIIINKTIKIKLFTKGDDLVKYYLIQMKQAMTIFYILGIRGNSQKDEEIKKEIFSKQEYAVRAQFIINHKQKYFGIKISSKKNVQKGLTFNHLFLQQQSPINQEINEQRYNCFKSPYKINQIQKIQRENIQYHYIQPENIRNFQPEGYHLTLSFQGNGARGTSYVGVNNAIKKLQLRLTNDSKAQIQLPIKSVIGSSSGGLLSLAISAGLEYQELFDLCYMMDTLIQDRLVQNPNNSQQTLHQINQKYQQSIYPQFYNKQQQSFKNILHNLGLVSVDLSNLLSEILKQPSVQQKIIAVLYELNPSIASILTFQQPYQLGQGETIKNYCGSCCCCCYSNCWTCCGLYPCCRALPGSNCFIQQSNQYRKINIYGLMNVAIMTGDAIQNIAAYALSLFLQKYARKKSKKLIDIAIKNKWFSQQRQENILEQIIKNSIELRKDYKQNPIKTKYIQNKLMKLSKTLTLIQYYQLSGVQFTCTGVDLQDRIVRFFNHKTTPFLPVSKAVQITVSFPVAFLALTWKKQWGKYYIYYDNIKEQVDLEGHQFTDGGLAADFPLEFLDNQKFRPKYFSHKIVKEKTLFYGFSADKFDDFPENDNSSKLSDKINDLISQLKYRLIYKFMFYTVKFSSHQTFLIKNLKLLQFSLQMFNALYQCDRNINKQCFKHQIIQTRIQKKIGFNKIEYEKYRNQLNIYFIDLQGQIQRHFSKFPKRIIEDQFNCIYYGFNHFQQLYADQKGYLTIQKQMNRVISQEQFKQIRRTVQNIIIYSPKCSEIYNTKIEQIKHRKLNGIVSNPIQYSQLQVLWMLHQLKQFTLQLNDQQLLLITNQMQKNARQYYIGIKEIYQTSLIQCQQDNYCNKPLYTNEQYTTELLITKDQLSPYVIHTFTKVHQLGKKMNLASLEFQQYINQNKIRIKDQISNNILYHHKDQNSQAIIHIILQATYNSHHYFTNYMKIVEESIINQSVKIGILTCTGYHAIYGLLYVLGYQSASIKKEMYRIQSLFQENPKINQIYNSKQWMKTSVQKIRNLLKKQWIQKKDPFSLLQNQYNKKGDKIFQNQQQFLLLNNTQDHFQLYKQQINSSLQKIITYISGSFQQILTIPTTKRKDRFEQLLNLGKYTNINSSQSKKGQIILNNLLFHTIDLLMNTAQYIFKGQKFTFFTEHHWNRQTLFKGMVINSLINSFKYKLYIYDILDNAALDRNITLSRLYQCGVKKILLNFNCINLVQQRFDLINKNTKPNMPVWAALSASASLPYITGPFQSNKQWQINQVRNIQIQKAKRIFDKKQPKGNIANYPNIFSQVKSKNTYTSGNLISSLPIQFMSNNKLKKSMLNFDDREIVQIVFAFDLLRDGVVSVNQENDEVEYRDNDGMSQRNLINSNKRQITAQSLSNQQQKYLLHNLSLKMQGKRRFINFIDIIKYIFEYIFCCCCDLNIGWYFQDLIGQMQIVKTVNTKINSHDNFIIYLYSDNIIKIPVRIDIFDFHKINQNNKNLEDTLLQAEEVTRQLCDTIQIHQNTKKIIFKPSKYTTIQLSNHKYDIFDRDTQKWQKQHQFYRIKFISYVKWRAFQYKYVIQYSADINQTNQTKILWTKINQDHIDIPKIVLDNQLSFLLKFTYYQNTIVQRIYLLTFRNLQTLDQNKAIAICRLNYRSIYCGEQKLEIFNQRNYFTGKAFIKSYFVQNASKYCNNLYCSAQPLTYVLMNEQYGNCHSCYDNNLVESNRNIYKKQLIAMECSKCKEQYCLKCKIKHFIQPKQTDNYVFNQQFYISPKNNGQQRKQQIQNYYLQKTPIKCQYLGENETITNNCLYCSRNCEKLWCEDVSKGMKRRQAFSGLRICQTCILNVY